MTPEPLKVLIIKNLLDQQTDDIDKFNAWLQRHTPFQNAQIDYLTTSFSALQYKIFKNINGQDWYGLATIKDILNSAGISPKGYHTIIFVYNQGAAATFPFSPTNVLAGGWTYPDPLNGAAFIEIPYFDRYSDSLDDLYRVLSHEIIHSFHRHCWWGGEATNDTMDLYDKDFEPDAPDGNRARNLAELAPYWPIAAGVETKQGMLIQLYSALIPLLVQIKAAYNMVMNPHASRIPDWANAAYIYEGNGPNDRATRNCNPGNLRYSGYIMSLGAAGKDKDNFAIFDNMTDGMNALKQFLSDVINWELIPYREYAEKNGRTRQNFNLFDFYRVYSPTSDSNDPDAYALFIANKLSVNPQDPIANLE